MSVPDSSSSEGFESFEDFFRYWNDRLRVFLRRRIYVDEGSRPPDDLVDEIAAEAFEAIYDMWSTVPPDKQRSFVFSTALRIVRRRAPGWRVEQEELREVEAMFARMGPREPTHDRVHEHEHEDTRRARCEDLVQLLPPRQQEAVRHRLDQLTIGEIAQKMGVTEGAVKAHLHQAVKTLRGFVEDSGNVLDRIDDGQEEGTA